MKNKILIGSIMFMTLMFWLGMTEKVYADTEAETEQESVTIEESGDVWEDEEPAVTPPETSGGDDEEHTTQPEQTSETITPENSTDPTEQNTTTKKDTTTMENATIDKAGAQAKPSGSNNDTGTIMNSAPSVEKPVVTYIDFGKKSKKKKTAKISVYTQGKLKTTKTKVIVKLQRKVKGKWKKYKIIKKSENSFYLYLKKNVLLKKKGQYRAVVTVYYYKKKKRIGKYKKISKKIKI